MSITPSPLPLGRVKEWDQLSVQQVYERDFKDLGLTYEARDPVPRNPYRHDKYSLESVDAVVVGQWDQWLVQIEASPLYKLITTDFNQPLQALVAYWLQMTTQLPWIEQVGAFLQDTRTRTLQETAVYQVQLTQAMSGITASIRSRPQFGAHSVCRYMQWRYSYEGKYTLRQLSEITEVFGTAWPGWPQMRAQINGADPGSQYVRELLECLSLVVTTHDQITQADSILSGLDKPVDSQPHQQGTP